MLYIELSIDIGGPRLDAKLIMNKNDLLFPMCSSMTAQTQNIFRFKIVSVLHEKELNWSNNMCLDYHNEVKIALKFETFIHLTKKSFGFFRI